MARNLYGATSADFTLTSGGRPIPNQTLTLWTARTGGTQITDLTDIYGTATTTVTSGADASIAYYGPDNDKSAHWAQAPQGNRFAIRPVDITGEAGPGSGILTTKGDILVRHSDADTRLPVGADGKLLIADSTQSTGLGWVSIGNLLTANQASGTDTLSDTTGFTAHTNCTLASSTAQALQGSRSLAVTATAAAWTMAISSQVPVDPGVAYTGSVASRAATAAAQCRVDIAFYTLGYSWLATVNGAQVSNTTAGWTTVTATGVAPAGAGLALVAYNFEAASVGHVHYTDCWGLWRGAGGQWVSPGLPVPGLGTRTNPSDTSQVQVWNEVTAAWITV